MMPRQESTTGRVDVYDLPVRTNPRFTGYEYVHAARAQLRLSD